MATKLVESSALRRFARALRDSANDQKLCLAACYSAGVAADIWLGQGAGGGQPFLLGVLVIMGMLIRLGRPMTAADACVVIAAHAALALAFGIDGVSWLSAASGDVVAAATGALLFLSLRRTGRIASQPALAVAACLTAAVAALAGVGMRFAFGGQDVFALWALAAEWSSAALPLALGLILTLSYGRNTGRSAASVGEIEDETPSHAIEHLISGAATAALGLAAIVDGRPLSMIAASLALLWFALRSGIFPTATAAFAFATALLTFGLEGAWPGLTSSAADEFSRAVSAALLTVPSVFVAAVVSDQRRLKMVYAYEASHDSLTRLANRTRYNKALDRALRSARASGERFVLMLIDLDHFKTVNDTHGHAVGDRLLIEVSDRLRQSVRASDLVARLGGDEFAVIAPIATINDAMTVAKRLVLAVNEPWELDGVKMVPSITLGGVVSPDNGVDRESITLLADEALYEAKRAGRNAWRFSSGERVAANDIVWIDAYPAIDGDIVMID